MKRPCPESADIVEYGGYWSAHECWRTGTASQRSSFERWGHLENWEVIRSFISGDVQVSKDIEKNDRKLGEFATRIFPFEKLYKY